MEISIMVKRGAAGVLVRLTCLAVLSFFGGGTVAFGQVLDSSGNPLFQDGFTAGVGKFNLTSSSKIVLLNNDAALTTILNAEGGWLEKLRYATGLQLLLTTGVTPGDGDIVLSNTPDAAFTARFTSATLTMSVSGNMKEKAIGGNVRSEGYQYLAGTTGVTLKFQENLGALRGIQSLVQMVMQDDAAPGMHRSLPTGSGIDYPKFAERLMWLDLSGQNMPPEQVIGFLEKMSQHKLNRLVLNVVDTATSGASFPLEFDAGDDPDGNQSTMSADLDASQLYDQADWLRLEAAAKRYGVEIIPLFNTTWSSSTYSNYGWPSGAFDTGAIRQNADNLARMTVFIGRFKEWFQSGSVGFFANNSFTGSDRADFIEDIQTALLAEGIVGAGKSVYVWDYEGVTYYDCSNAIRLNFSGLGGTQLARYAGRRYIDGSAGPDAAHSFNSGVTNPVRRFYQQQRHEPANIYDTGFTVKREHYSNHAIPEGMMLSLRDAHTLNNPGGSSEWVNALFSGGFAGIGLVNWYGLVRQGGNFVDYATVGYDNLIPVSHELLSYWVRDRFPYLTGAQAMTVLYDASRHVTIVSPGGLNITVTAPGERASDWMAWDTTDMEKAMEGPSNFASGMFVVDMVGVGNVATNGLMCTQFACSLDTWSSVIGGSGGLHKKGPGILALVAGQSFTGGERHGGGRELLGVVAVPG
ncbi:MAG: hypothetical protein OXC81_03985, partial [Betaproteobacteria bacterium]|nr:hypothetical protein [Betaproteobacteria bacterium]